MTKCEPGHDIETVEILRWSVSLGDFFRHRSLDAMMPVAGYASTSPWHIFCKYLIFLRFFFKTVWLCCGAERKSEAKVLAYRGTITFYYNTLTIRL